MFKPYSKFFIRTLNYTLCLPILLSSFASAQTSFQKEQNEKFMKCLAEGKTNCSQFTLAPETTFFYKLGKNKSYKIFTSPDSTTPVGSLEHNSLIPFRGMSQGRAILTARDGSNLYVELENDGAEIVDAKNQIPLYLDRPEGVPVTLFPNAGMTWRDCDISNPPTACKDRVWPKAGSRTQFFVQDAQVLRQIDPLTGKEEFNLYYRVNGEYYPDGKQEPRRFQDLWISGDDVRENPLKASLLDDTPRSPRTPAPTAKPDDCDPQKKSDVESQLRKLEKEIPLQSFLEDRTLIDSLLDPQLGGIGSCLKNKNTRIPRSVTNPFKDYVEKHWKNRDLSKTSMNYKNKKLEKDQLFAIDAMARTVFGEMRGCVKKGARYPMSVARVMLNRAYFARAHAKKSKGSIRALSFVRDLSPSLSGQSFDYRNASIEETLTRVISSDRQFSAWNKNDHNVHISLCPKDLKGQDLEAWRKSVKIAADAVLNRKNFRDQTSEVTMLHYSSDMTPYWAKNKTLARNVNIGGLPLDSKKCIMLWSDSTSRNFDWQVQQWIEDLYKNVMNPPSEETGEITFGIFVSKD